MIMMESGSWNDPNRLHFNATGTSSDPIILTAERPGQLTLTGKVQIVFSGRYQEIRGVRIEGTSDDKVTPVWFEPWSRNCRFTNSRIRNFNRQVHDKMHHWVEAWGAYHTVDYCTFDQKEETGQILRVKTENGDFKPPGATPSSYGHKFQYNYFGPRPVTSNGDDGEGIQIGLRESEFMDTDTLVEFNLFEEYDAEIECVSVKGSNNRVRFNTFRESACTLNLRHTDNTIVQENYFFCNGKDRCGGVRVGGGDDHTVLSNYVERPSSTSGIISGLTVYAAPDDPYVRRPVRNLLAERNFLIYCTKHCLASGYQDSSQGETFPDGTRFIKNIMYANGASDDYAIRDYGRQTNPYWEINYAYNGRVEPWESSSGIREEDPGLTYDSEWEMYRVNVDVDIKMQYKPLSRGDVGVSW